MYFSGINDKSITFDDPDGRCIRVNRELYTRVEDDNEQNARVFLDTRLLRIRSKGVEGEIGSEKLITKSDVSVSVETRASLPILFYVTNALILAEFREISSNEFKDRYLAPLDKAIKMSSLAGDILSRKYSYPLGDAMHVENDIQRYFDKYIAREIDELYRNMGGEHHYFGKPSIIRPPLERKRIIQPDIVHLAGNVSMPNDQCPEICYAIGVYKKGNYYLAEGFKELKATIKDHKERIPNTRVLRLQSTRSLFQDREWTPRVICALVLRKYLYQALLCGTNRVFISDHQLFSSFLEYRITDNNRMAIDYYIINDPETVANGITLRSAMTGFFYNSDSGARDIRERLRSSFKVGKQTKGSDPFGNILPRPIVKSLYNRKGGMLSEDELLGNLEPIEEDDDINDYGEICGNTYCRIIYDALKWYPGLGLKLPPNVFVKMYNYPKLAFESFPEKCSYYDMFVNELEMNILISKSQFRIKFPKLIASGYWNGMSTHPMHIFEYLGEEKPMEKWDYDRVYEVIQERLKELHLMGIAHNDVRLGNIHVSISGRISLIDFGLSTCPSTEKLKQDDLIALDHIFSKTAEENNQATQNYNDDQIVSMHSVDDSFSVRQCNDANNSYDETVFDRMSEHSRETESTKEDTTFKR
ncbi:uncharacterized protein AC631_01088 [Debaryomyces fabryi]|uniref:Protein kinase domain-containing protein n=1 Tax=Debaryomyces fabryi TaxID=58627 RepID=A0A0V1Q3Z6_9ASCO|nr:uncharacterized protein AC631_01088 [Debaryomyces fabryi]KSA03191.1 hypothetical protein AC631_01088 [Debaryomyces fabryi]CUM48469.1 unnamed protein product [Debaryomyces fabryi]